MQLPEAYGLEIGAGVGFGSPVNEVDDRGGWPSPYAEQTMVAYGYGCVWGYGDEDADSRVTTGRTLVNIR